jgi:hypothetical protein
MLADNSVYVAFGLDGVIIDGMLPADDDRVILFWRGPGYYDLYRYRLDYIWRWCCDQPERGEYLRICKWFLSVPDNFNGVNHDQNYIL